MAETRNPGAGTVTATASQGKKLLERAWDALLEAGFEQVVASRYVDRMRRYILFHNKRHPQEMGLAEVEQYLGSPPFAQPGGPERRVEAERATRSSCPVRAGLSSLSWLAGPNAGRAPPWMLTNMDPVTRRQTGTSPGLRSVSSALRTACRLWIGSL